MRSMLGFAVAAAAALVSPPASASVVASYNMRQSYTVSTTVDLAHIATYNRYASGAGITNSFQLAAPGGTITDPFVKSSANPPLITYLLGVTFSPASGDHLVLALDPGFAGAIGSSDFASTFAGYEETALIDALTTLDTADLPADDPGYAAQMLAKNAAVSLLFNFSGFVGDAGGLVSADGGNFELLSFSTPTVVGRGTANLSRVAVPEAGTWVLMIGGFGAVGIALRRRRNAVTA